MGVNHFRMVDSIIFDHVHNFKRHRLPFKYCDKIL
jgi:hypothetical protein